MNTPTPSPVISSEKGADPTASPPPPVTLLENLTRARLSKENLDHIQQIREILGLKPNDALWALFVALEFYWDLYRRFPPMIRAAATEILVEHKAHADATLETSIRQIIATADQFKDQFKGELSEAVRAAAADTTAQLTATLGQHARRAARQARLERLWPWLLAGGVVIALSFAGAIGAGFGYGRYAGYAEGLAAAHAASVQSGPPRSPAR